MENQQGPPMNKLREPGAARAILLPRTQQPPIRSKGELLVSKMNFKLQILARRCHRLPPQPPLSDGPRREVFQARNLAPTRLVLDPPPRPLVSLGPRMEAT